MTFALRSAFRTIRRSPGLSLVIVLSLALGIGANTAIFSWLKGSVFHALPGVSAPVLLLETKDDTGHYVATSWLEYQDLRGLLPSFAGVAAQRTRTLHLGDSERDEPVFAELVSENFFSVLGLQPQLGRFFRPEEVSHPYSAPVAVLSHEYWQHQFQGAPDILGRELRLNGQTFTVIGIAPPKFRGGLNHLAYDVFLPITMGRQLIPATTELTNRYNRPYAMLAQLQPGTTLAQARGELAAAAQHLIATHPETNRGLSYELLPLWRSPRGGEIAVLSLATLQAFATLILIVVCANTASLLLARASTRHREIGIRLAIGAGSSRILGQLLLESVCLALLGAGGGLLVALWGLDALAGIPLPGGLPIRLMANLDWTSVSFAVVLAVACGLAFGLAPAWQLARSNVLDSLRGGRGSIGGRNRMRDLLIGLEVGIALVVLVLAGLFLKSFHNARVLSPGFEPERVVLATLDLGGRGYNQKTGGALLDDLLQRLEQLPGVSHAAASNFVPLDLRGVAIGVISIEGREFDPNRKILYYSVTPGYFDTLGIPLLSGTDIAPQARPDLPQDAVIDDEMARRYWPDEDPVGRRFEVDGSTYVIAGVARTPKLQRMNETPRAAAWLPIRRTFVSAPILQVRATEGDPRALLSAIRATVHSLDPEIAIRDTRSLGEHLESSLFLERMTAHILTVLAPLALALAAIGLYAVIAHAVVHRTQEIGVRLMLGAPPRAVVGLVMWQSLRIVLVATALGWLAALGAGWYLRTLLVGVPFGDPTIYAGIPLLLLGVAVLACFLPARRATRISPLQALNTE